MAGACLPHLALVGPPRVPGHSMTAIAGKPRMRCSARRTTTRRVPARSARSAICGSASSRSPAHEHLWWNVPILTHAASAWAMDRHFARHLFRPPAMLLQDDGWLVDYVAASFDCTPAASRHVIRQLAGGGGARTHRRARAGTGGMPDAVAVGYVRG